MHKEAYLSAAQWLQGLSAIPVPPDAGEMPEGFQDVFAVELKKVGLDIDPDDPLYIGSRKPRRPVGPICARIMNAWFDIRSRYFKEHVRPFRGITEDDTRRLILIGALLWKADFKGMEVDLDWVYESPGSVQPIEGREWADLILYYGGEQIGVAVAAALNLIKNISKAHLGQLDDTVNLVEQSAVVAGGATSGMAPLQCRLLTWRIGTA